MANWKDFLVKKVAVVSHDYNLINRYGHQDFAEHFSQINKVCDSKGCNTILYSLFTWDEKSPVPRNHQSVFEGLKNIECDKILLLLLQITCQKMNSMSIYYLNFYQ